MKKCPFCAEEIQDAAIKCRFCGSFLTTSGNPSAAPQAAPGPAGVPQAAPRPAGAPAPNAPPFHREAAPEPPGERKVLYDGAPSWRVYVGLYLWGTLGATLALALCIGVGWPRVESTGKAFLLLGPLAATAIYFAALTFYRRSLRFRVTNTNIEVERGILTKRIDVVELWRCRDVRYRQTLTDRLLGLAHIEIFSADATTPVITMTGLPDARKLFEHLRDCIEIQRQSKNVYGVVS